MAQSKNKVSYTIPCPTDFRDAVMDLAERRQINAADLLRSIVLVLSEAAIREFPDPGEPLNGDRETIILKSGKSKGRPWQRKPRLQVRMTKGFEIGLLRRALNVALAMDQGAVEIHVEAPKFGLQVETIKSRRDGERARMDLDKLKSMISVLAFDPLARDIETRADALYVLGYHAMARPTGKALSGRFRQLATLYHPDSGYGSHERMSQLNSAMEYLKTHRD
jgi:hypothetical protein